jgi:hypothetical protein
MELYTNMGEFQKVGQRYQEDMEAAYRGSIIQTIGHRGPGMIM